MKILMIFAHPDDETFGLGGTTIKLTKQGHTVNLITATRGEAGLPGTPPITTMDKLPKVREEELKKAAKITGIKKIYFLNEIDATLHKIKTEKLVKKILPIINSEKPDVVITFDSTGASNHPDHKAISKAATRAFYTYAKSARKHVKLYHTAIPRSNLKKLENTNLEYKAFGKVQGTNDDLITTKINIKKEFPIKVKAMREHKTQNKDWERIIRRKFAIDMDHEYLRLIYENDLS